MQASQGGTGDCPTWWAAAGCGGKSQQCLCHSLEPAVCLALELFPDPPHLFPDSSKIHQPFSPSNKPRFLNVEISGSI